MEVTKGILIEDGGKDEHGKERNGEEEDESGIVEGSLLGESPGAGHEDDCKELKRQGDDEGFRANLLGAGEIKKRDDAVEEDKWGGEPDKGPKREKEQKRSTGEEIRCGCGRACEMGDEVIDAGCDQRRREA